MNMSTSCLSADISAIGGFVLSVPMFNQTRQAAYNSTEKRNNVWEK